MLNWLVKNPIRPDQVCIDLTWMRDGMYIPAVKRTELWRWKWQWYDHRLVRVEGTHKRKTEIDSFGYWVQVTGIESQDWVQTILMIVRIELNI